MQYVFSAELQYIGARSVSDGDEDGSGVRTAVGALVGFSAVPTEPVGQNVGRNVTSGPCPLLLVDGCELGLSVGLRGGWLSPPVG